jgi:hypothetical protein
MPPPRHFSPDQQHQPRNPPPPPTPRPYTLLQYSWSGKMNHQRLRMNIPQIPTSPSLWLSRPYQPCFHGKPASASHPQILLPWLSRAKGRMQNLTAWSGETSEFESLSDSVSSGPSKATSSQQSWRLLKKADGQGHENRPCGMPGVGCRDGVLRRDDRVLQQRRIRDCARFKAQCVQG